MRSATGVMRNRDFRLLWAGQTVSELGSGVSTLAIPLLAVRVLHASALQVGELTAAGTAGYLLVGLPAGAWVDRVRRRRLMIVSDLVRFAMLGSVPVAGALGVLKLAQLYIVTFAVGLVNVFFSVAYQAYVPAVLAREQLSEGNARLAGSAEVAEVAAPGLAGWAVQAVGGANTTGLDALTFLFSAVTLTSMRTADTRVAREPGSTGDPARRGGLIREAWEGGRFVLDNRLLRTLTGVTSVANFCFAAATAVMVLFLVKDLRQSSVVIGLLYAAGGVGGVLGAVVASWVAGRMGIGRSALAGMLAFAVGTVMWPLATRGAGILWFAGGSLLVSLGMVMFNVSQGTLRQRVCPPRLLGRVIASMRFVVCGPLPVGALAGGAIGAAAGLRTTLWLAAAGSAAAAVWLMATRALGERLPDE
jgi:MFS family permease